MVMAATLSERLGLIESGFVKRLTQLIQRANLPIVGPKLAVDRYLELMRVDKKSEGGEIKFVVIDKPGSAAVRGAPDALVADVLRDCCVQ
jgi:3-dehydroquinate synthase